MRIKTGYCALRFFRDSFLKKYNLTQYSYYSDAFKPIVHFGCYQGQYKQVLNHKGLLLLVWAGSDAMILTPKSDIVRLLKSHKNIHHIAIGNFISDDLTKCGIIHTKVPVVCISNQQQFKPVPLGKKVYVYGINDNPELYGRDIVHEVMRRMPHVEFMVKSATGINSVPKDEMHKVYAECCIGLRPTKHDGLSTSVIELGLMGRYCITNNYTPNSIAYNTVDQICEIIDLTLLNVGRTNDEVSKRVADFINIGDDWLNIENYKN